MFTRKLQLNTVDKVKTFIDLMHSYSYSADITSGRYIVNAQSIMGVFSLNLEKPVTIVVHCTDEQDSEAAAELAQLCKDFIVKED